MSKKPNLEDYVEVNERIAAFYEAYPEGTLQCGGWDILEVGEATFVYYLARAYRTPDDERPGEGVAWEPFPGKTPYTKDSEIMNAETSAWGRALASLGFEVKRSIASANEVRNRQDNGSHENGPAEGLPVSPKQRDLIERLVAEAKVATDAGAEVMPFVNATLSGGQNGSASKAIDGLMTDKKATAERLLVAARAWQVTQSDVPADDADLGPVTDDRDAGEL